MIEAKVIMIVITVLWHTGSGVAQTATETTAATCEAAQKQLNGKLDVRTGDRSSRDAYRRVDCIPIKK